VANSVQLLSESNEKRIVFLKKSEKNKKNFIFSYSLFNNDLSLFREFCVFRGEVFFRMKSALSCKGRRIDMGIGKGNVMCSGLGSVVRYCRYQFRNTKLRDVTDTETENECEFNLCYERNL
jgi:hypothetical protein